MINSLGATRQTTAGSQATPPARAAGSVAEPQDGFDPRAVADAQVLEMGLGGWMQHCEKAGAFSERDWDEAAMRYYEVRSTANEAARAQLPDGGRALKLAVENIGSWVSERLNLTYEFNGGGTMYRHAQPREAAALAEVESKCIAQYNDATEAICPAPPEAFRVNGSQPYEPLPNGIIGVSMDDYRVQLDDEAKLLDASAQSLHNLPPAPFALLAQYMANAGQWGPERG